MATLEPKSMLGQMGLKEGFLKLDITITLYFMESTARWEKLLYSLSCFSFLLYSDKKLSCPSSTAGGGGETKSKQLITSQQKHLQATRISQAFQEKGQGPLRGAWYYVKFLSQQWGAMYKLLNTPDHSGQSITNSWDKAVSSWRGNNTVPSGWDCLSHPHNSNYKSKW